MKIPFFSKREVPAVWDQTTATLRRIRACENPAAAQVVFEAFVYRAIQAEREACAKIAERYEPDERSPRVTYASRDIRAR